MVMKIQGDEEKMKLYVLFIKYYRVPGPIIITLKHYYNIPKTSLNLGIGTIEDQKFLESQTLSVYR